MMLQGCIEAICQQHMRDKAGRYIAARVQAALALLERVREFPSLLLDDHRASAGSAGLKGHETYGDRALSHLGLNPINKNHGRRSSHLQEWGQKLLDGLGQTEFADLDELKRSSLIDKAQQMLAEVLRGIIEQDPLRVSWRGKSVESVVGLVLDQADEKGRIGEVAQYLVGAKLRLRLPDIDIPVQGANVGDRRFLNDPNARRADYDINDTAIEVAMGPPDKKHVLQIVEILDDPRIEVWLIARERHLSFWKDQLKEAAETDSKRVVVLSIESFLGQNISEIGILSSEGKSIQLKELVRIYNEEWVDKVSNPGIRIELI